MVRAVQVYKQHDSVPIELFTGRMPESSTNTALPQPDSSALPPSSRIGLPPPQVVATVADTLRVLFTSDSSGHGNGFEFSFREIEHPFSPPPATQAAACAGNLVRFDVDAGDEAVELSWQLRLVGTTEPLINSTIVEVSCH